ncbi:28393_t:CDS:2, partial [Dentiscutata erythropus]
KMQFVKTLAILALIAQLTVITPSWALERRFLPRRPNHEATRRGIELAIIFINSLS